MEHSLHEFTELMTGHQQRLYRYIVSLVGDADAAWDVLQETNRVLLEKRGEFEADTHFVNWALTIAQFQTMAWLRNRNRDRLIPTSEIVELLADDARRMNSESDRKIQALKVCLERLPVEQKEYLNRRYARSETLSELAERTGRSTNALKQLFFRLRMKLIECINYQTKTE